MYFALFAYFLRETERILMRVLYPCNPLNPKEADEVYQEEYQTLQLANVKYSLFDFDAFVYGEFKPKPSIEPGDLVLYRGWMLKLEYYQHLVSYLEGRKAFPFTTYQNYLKCHHLPGWYEPCKAYTPETKFFPDDHHLIKRIEALGWDSYFVKDYVKSNSTARGSIASSPTEAVEIIQLIKKYRGSIEGGIAIRRVERCAKDTETRYFVMNGQSYSPTNELPEIVETIAGIVSAPFFSLDIIRREDGVLRLVEIGDGQVSDKKMWSTAAFSAMLIEDA